MFISTISYTYQYARKKRYCLTCILLSKTIAALKIWFYQIPYVYLANTLVLPNV